MNIDEATTSIETSIMDLNAGKISNKEFRKQIRSTLRQVKQDNFGFCTHKDFGACHPRLSPNGKATSFEVIDDTSTKTFEQISKEYTDKDLAAIEKTPKLTFIRMF